MNFQGKLTMERQFFNPKITVLEWSGPHNLYLAKHILTETIPAELPAFMDQVKQKLSKSQEQISEKIWPVDYRCTECADCYDGTECQVVPF